MQIHELKDVSTGKRKRVGRGGKRGTYAGRGMNGQKSRSGGNVDPLFEGGRSSLVQRMKKNRGFKSPHAKSTVLSLSTIDKNYADGETVSVETLLAKKLLRVKVKSDGVRIVAGEVSKKITIAPDVTVTASAKESLEKAGGKVEEAKKD